MGDCLTIRHFQRRDAEGSGLPDGLWQVKTPPHELFIQGSETALPLLQRLPGRGLAIVGTRGSQERSSVLVRSVISRLKGFDLVILSGLARGVDTQAHLAALEAGLPTIAILGCGLSRTYPIENEDLRRRILENGGLIISEFVMDERPRAAHFIQRNRLIAGWSMATWVVEASYRSGALNTANWARRHERDTYATPCFPGDPRLAGNQKLLDAHHAFPLWDAASLSLTWLGLESHLALNERPKSEAGTVPRDGGPVQQLASTIARMQIELGGTPLDALLDWSASCGWPPEKFFATLDRALDERLIEQTQRGFVLTHSS